VGGPTPARCLRVGRTLSAFAAEAAPTGDAVSAAVVGGAGRRSASAAKLLIVGRALFSQLKRLLQGGRCLLLLLL
jgi:hypothetical protein